MKGLITNQLGLIRACLSVTTLEAKLAVNSVLPLLVTVFLLFICILSTWFTVLVLIAYSLMQMVHSVLLVLVSMIGLHGIVLVILWYCFRFNLKQLSFQKTRAYFKGAWK